ncbi:MAG: Holliday junction resolvase RuvX [Anaerolineae bacterium]|jgi:putative Holliday junction resolvase|nr:Holliday junction resolvase RuvX [Anaerolineae bacterium]
MSGRLIGLDHGLKRIGVALSDASRRVARELLIVQRSTRQADFDRLNAIAAQESATGFIIGVPYSDAPAGTHTQADTVRLWISRFAATTALPVVPWDEQLSSDDAREIARLQRRRFDAPIDDLAARVILQSYLDALHDGLATFPHRS